MNELDRKAAAFAALDHFSAQRRRAEIGLMLSVAELIECYEIDDERVFAGMERVVRPGAHGTSEVGEFLALEVAARLGISPTQGMNLVADVLNVSQRHPRTWRAFLDGQTSWKIAQKIAAECLQLSSDQAKAVDAKIARLVKQGSCWESVSRNICRLKNLVAPELQRMARLHADSTRGVWFSNLEGGNVQLRGRLAGADGIALDQALTQIAATLPAPEPIVDPATGQLVEVNERDQKRAAALGILARGAFGQDPLPMHTLVVHIDARDVINADIADADNDRDAGPRAPGCGIATVEKWGELLIEALPEFLSKTQVSVRPVLDPAAIAPVDAYQIPDVMRFAIEQRNPRDVFPFGTRPAGICDMDHTQPYQAGVDGQTTLSNLGPLSRRTHRAKTHGDWQLSQPKVGIFCWQSPGGAKFVVTNSGTMRLDHPENYAKFIDDWLIVQRRKFPDGSPPVFWDMNVEWGPPDDLDAPQQPFPIPPGPRGKRRRPALV